jgi:hypothetical protein
MLVIVNTLLRGKWTEIAKFLLVADGKCSSRLLDNCWALLKGFRRAAGKHQKVL